MSDDFFGGAPTLSWARRTENDGYVDREDMLGKIRGGVIVDIPGKQQATDMVSGKPAWWEPPTGTPGQPDYNPGRPKWQYVVVLRCDGSRGGAVDERQSGVGNDNGDRRLFIPDGDMRKAVGDAFRANGCRGLTVGDELYVAWTGRRPSKMKGGKAAKTWAAKHVKGTPTAQQWPQDGEQGGAAPEAGGNPFAAPAAQQAPAAPPQQQQQQAAPPAAPPADNPFGGPLPSQQPATAGAQAANPFG